MRLGRLGDGTPVRMPEPLARDPVTPAHRVHPTVCMADLTCDRCAELLGDYVEGRLAPDVLGALEGHVGSCAACAALVRDYEAIPGFVREATDVRMPHEVEIRLRRLLKLAWRRPRE